MSEIRRLIPGTFHTTSSAARREMALKQQMEFFQQLVAAFVRNAPGGKLFVPREEFQAKCELTVTMKPEGAELSVGAVPVIVSPHMNLSTATQ